MVDIKMDDAHTGEIREKYHEKLPYSSRGSVSIENLGLQTATSSSPVLYA
jgi:hypothetical protein